MTSTGEAPKSCACEPKLGTRSKVRGSIGTRSWCEGMCARARGSKSEAKSSQGFTRRPHCSLLLCGFSSVEVESMFAVSRVKLKV